MQLATKYNKLVKGKLLHYATWSPVTDGFSVGDFGAFRRGVFQRLGNIREFGVDPGAQPGASNTKFDFTSSGAVIVRSTVEGAVDVFPDQPIEAKLSIDFKGETSVFIRTSELAVEEMKSIDAVARALKGKRDATGRRWKLRWRVVRKVYTAKDPAILASSQKEASFTLSGKADALKKLELGHASADIVVTSTSSDSIKISGGTGPVALDLFRVRVTGSAGLEGVAPVEDDGTFDFEPDLDDDWSDEPDDDDDDLFA